MRADRDSPSYPTGQSDSPSIGSRDGIMPLLEAIGERKDVLDLDGDSETLARLLLSRGCRVTRPSVADLDAQPLATCLGDARFDVVFVARTLLQLRNPARVLEELRSFLAEGGYVVAAVPNAAHGAIRLAALEGRSTGYESTRGFTARTLDELFLAAGYALSHLDRIKVALFERSEHLPQVWGDLVSDDVRAQIEQDPEHDTLRFIARAQPLSDEGRHRLLARRFFNASAEAHDLRVENARREALAQSLRTELAESKRYLSDADTEMRVAQARASDLEQELGRARADLEEHVSASIAVRGEHDRLRAQIETLANAAAQSAQQLAGVERERASIAARVEQIEAELGVFAWSNNELLARVLHTGEERDTAREERDAAIEERDAFQAQLHASRTAAANAAERLDAVERSLERERTAREDAERDAAELAAQFQRHVELAIERANAQAQELASALDEVHRSRFWRLKRFLRRVFLRER